MPQQAQPAYRIDRVAKRGGSTWQPRHAFPGPGPAGRGMWVRAPSRPQGPLRSRLHKQCRDRSRAAQAQLIETRRPQECGARAVRWQRRSSGPGRCSVQAWRATALEARDLRQQAKARRPLGFSAVRRLAKARAGSTPSTTVAPPLTNPAAPCVALLMPSAASPCSSSWMPLESRGENRHPGSIEERFRRLRTLL